VPEINLKLLTPPDLPDDVIKRRLEIPASQEWLGVFNYLIILATYVWNWEQLNDTDLDPSTCASTVYEIYVKYLHSADLEETPTPFWDTPEDSDDELPAQEQPWYGIFDGSFHETLENFVIAGFIAASGQVGAAITFLTIAPKFRLAWKTGDIGGIIRIFIDSADAGTVDTYSASPGVLEKDFVGDPDNDEHLILMVLESLHV